MEAMRKAQWIWLKEEKDDGYGEFRCNFTLEEIKDVKLKLSFDGFCSVFVNGELAFFKQCADYPYYKIYDEIDITRFCKKDNEIIFNVYHMGLDTFIYYKARAGLIFEVIGDGKVAAYSSEQTESREDIRYKNGYKKIITVQIGYSFYFDNSLEGLLPFEKSVTVEKTRDLHKNKLKPLELKERLPFKIINADEKSVLIDLGRECAGFLDIDIDSAAEQNILIAYGEHIEDGKVRRIIGSRDFSVEIRLKKGENKYLNALRRIAGRYLEIFFEKEINIKYSGIRPVYYPITEKPFIAKNEAEQKIYDTSVKTLRLCMHEHYEDCPWREQSMYQTDSRNQMLCGYYAFNETEFARENLVLMSKGMTGYGLTELTFPARNTPIIPSFNLAYVVAVKEYIEYTKDESILKEIGKELDRIIETFASRIEENGLIANFGAPFWNFYEWSEGSANTDEIERKDNANYKKQYDLLLNCMYVNSVNAYNEISGRKIETSRTIAGIRKTFFNKEIGLFFASTANENLYTELGNAFAVLSGAAENAEEICKKLAGKNDMVEVTLSMSCFKYDALLKTDEKYSEYVESDINECYGYMLKKGATSFWETLKGESDFDGAGSLCHGWSAMPVYYFNKFGRKENGNN